MSKKKVNVDPKISVMVDLANYMTAGESGSKLPKKIQVLPIGTWETEQYGPMSITAEFLGMLVENFKRGLRKGLPIDKDHNRQEAMGWMDNPTIVEDGENPGLYCDTEWTPLGEQLLGGKIYRFFSPEWSDDYVDPETGIHHGPVLIAGTLTNRPLFKELTPLVAHETNLTNAGGAVVLLAQSNNPSNKPMTQELQNALAKKASELTAEEKSLIKTNQAELNDEQRKTFEEVLGEVEKTPEELEAEKAEQEKQEAEAKATAEAEAAAKAEADAKAQADAEVAKTAAETIVTMTAAEKDALVKTAEEGRAAIEILENKKAEETAQGFLMSEDGKSGKILPAAKDVLTKLVRSFSDTQMKYFSEVVNNIPEAKYFQEIGKSAVTVEAKTAFEAKVQEVITASEGKLTLKQAQLEVAANHPELYEAYEAGLKTTSKKAVA